MNKRRLRLYYPETDMETEVPVNDLGGATPGELIQFLQSEGVELLPREDQTRPYVIEHGGRRLDPKRTFAEQGVTDDTALEIQHEGTAMRRAEVAR